MTIVPQENVSYKRCYSCQQSFPATSEFFSSNRSKKDGFADACKTCDKARRKAYREAHREQEYESRKLYRENNAERLREEKKLYRETHKDEIAESKKLWQQGDSYKEYQRQYYQDHKEEINKQGAQYYQAHQEEACERQRLYLQTELGRMVDKAHKHKRRAQKKASGGSYTPQQLQEQMHRQKSKCYYCKVKLGKIYHADHVVPLARGGTNDISNIVIACPTCNLRKKAKLPHEWFEGGRLL